MEESMDNEVPRIGSSLYSPGQSLGFPFVCDYAHEMECDGTCLRWTDDLLEAELFPLTKICFPSFDDAYGNCSLQRTHYENRHILNPEGAL